MNWPKFAQWMPLLASWCSIPWSADQRRRSENLPTNRAACSPRKREKHCSPFCRELYSNIGLGFQTQSVRSNQQIVDEWHSWRFQYYIVKSYNITSWHNITSCLQPSPHMFHPKGLIIEGRGTVRYTAMFKPFWGECSCMQLYGVTYMQAACKCGHLDWCAYYSPEVPTALLIRLDTPWQGWGGLQGAVLTTDAAVIAS